jgi:exonuclease SbcC
LDHVLLQLEAAYEQHEKGYSTYLATESSLRETGKQLKETINVQEQEVSTKEVALAAHKEIWESFAIYSNSTNVLDEQKTTWLTQQLRDARTKQKDLQHQIQSYATKNQELDMLYDKVNDLDRQLNESTNAFKDAKRTLQSLQEKWAQYNKEQLNNNNALSEIEKSLSIYFTAKDWFGHWKDDPASFLQNISGFAEKWRANTQKLEDDTRQHGVLSATFKATQEQLQNLSAEVQRKQILFTSLKEQQDVLIQKRKDIFNGEAAATVELGLKQDVIVAQHVLEKSKADQEQLQTEITRIGIQKDQVEKDIEALQQQGESFVQKIQQWLTTFNDRNNFALDTEGLLQLLILSPEWIETERAALRAIDDAITQALSVLQERTTQLRQHEQQRFSERSAEDLNELLNTAKGGLQQQIREKNEIGFRLQQDLDNKQKIGDLLGVIEAKALIVENWAKLNEIIGSADGKKFRQIAQEYTLDVLLSYANVHLEMLNKRYLLQRIPNTLGLQVLDQDMGNEVRTVYSLSGGESFLVSLALALGLASLSSNRMQVESLFIDEGFGSLDSTTLNIAMDALERLHNEGRKVGIISHMQEMTERIPVQINVNKLHSGASIIEVKGC